MTTVYRAQLEYDEPPREYELMIQFGLFATKVLACSAVEASLRVPQKLIFAEDNDCPGLWTVELPKDAGLTWLALREDYGGPSIASIWAKQLCEALEDFKPWWTPLERSEEEEERDE